MKAAAERVLMTVDALGGVWNYALELCRGMPDTRFLLACMGPAPSSAQIAELANLSHVELEMAPFKLEWMEDPWEDVEAAGGWLRDLAASFGPQIIHLNGYSHAALPWHVPVMVVAHSCVLSWWRAVKGVEAPASWQRYRWKVTQGLGAADVVIAPTHSMAESLSAEYRTGIRASVIYNGRRGRCLQNLVPKQPMVLSVGRLWDEAKNAGMLAGVAADLPWPVVLAGEAIPPGGAAKSFRNVTLTGHLPADRISILYDQAMIYAAPAKYEPFGLSVLEAALAGCALVLSDIPSLREIWDGAALYVPPDDPHALGRMLMGLISRPAETQRLGTNARSRALLYSSARMAAAYDHAYASLLRNGRRSLHLSHQA